MVERRAICPATASAASSRRSARRARDTTELFFDDCRVPASSLLGAAEGQGFRPAHAGAAYERTLIAVQAVAAIERALGVTVDYVKQRHVFGKPLLDLQNTRFKLAEAKTQAHVARVFLDSCIERLMRGELDTVTASMAKWWTTICSASVDECLQLHGGYGYMLEYPIAQCTPTPVWQRIYGGATRS
jgi:acyl-CoA dehydrogenase